MLTGGQYIRYGGVSGNSLISIPTTGPGSIQAAIASGTQVVGVPALTGVNSNNGVTQAVAAGSTINLWVQRDDLDAQAALALLELDENGNPTDGVHEHVLNYPAGTSVALCNAFGDNELAVFARPIIGVEYPTYDLKTRVGMTVTVDTEMGMFDPAIFDPKVFDIMAAFGIKGSFVIQDITITLDTPTLPRLLVKAMSVKFTFSDLLRKVQLAA